MAKTKNNILRGKILSLLHDMYPDGITELDVVGIYYQYHQVDDIKRELQYLADKEYCSKTEYPHPYKKGETIITYKLLPQGIDLINGDIPSDPGIIVTPEV